MLTTEEIDELPRALPLTDWSQREIIKADANILVRRSQHCWSLSVDGEILLIIGVYVPSLTSVPELWLLMTQGFNRPLRRNLQFARDQMVNLLAIYPRLEARIDKSFTSGVKFARMMGFNYLQTQRLNDGKDYEIYEVRRGC